MSFLFRLSLVGVLWLMLLTATTARAQTEVTAGPDSVEVATPASPIVPDSVRRTTTLFGRPVTVPAKAAWLSLMLPGAGQIYNRKYWKLPLVYGGIGATVYYEAHYWSLYREFVQGYDNLRAGKPDTGPTSSQFTTLDDKLRGIVFYRRYRDQFLAYIAVAYGLNVLDALVDAHLRDFDVSDDLSLHWTPTVLYMPTAMMTPGLSVTLSFPSTRSPRK